MPLKGDQAIPVLEPLDGPLVIIPPGIMSGGSHPVKIKAINGRIFAGETVDIWEVRIVALAGENAPVVIKDIIQVFLHRPGMWRGVGIHQSLRPHRL